MCSNSCDLTYAPLQFLAHPFFYDVVTRQIIFNHLNAQGNIPTVGTLLTSQFVGIGMNQDVYVGGNGPYSGVQFEEIEIITFNFGDEMNHIFINETSETIAVSIIQ